MLDFEAVRDGSKSLDELTNLLTWDDLRDLTNEMINSQLRIISKAEDEDITFIPVDPDAYDPFAESESEIDMPWTLGHIIVHVTASSEESAFLSAELARGVRWRGGRSRYEVPWQRIKTVSQCRNRLEESRRIRLACLDVWPNPPDLNNTYQTTEGVKVSAILQFIYGLYHEYSHIDQIKEILKQAKSVIL